MWVRNIGILVLLFLVYQLWGTRFEEAQSQARLRISFAHTAAVPNPPAPRSAPSNSPSQPHGAPILAPVATLPGGVVARLEIPSIHVDQYVVEGTTDVDLRKGPGHYVGTPLPGEPGNVAIAGHRTTFGAPFNRIGRLRPGDSIIASTRDGEFEYVVATQRSVSPSQVSVIDDYGDNRLTLTTCTPEFSATQRLVVVAMLRGRVSPAALVVAHVTPPVVPRPTPVHPASAVAARALLGSGPGGWRLHALPAVLAWGGALVALALAYRPVRRRLPPLAAVTVLAPFWLVGMMYLFHQATSFLPSNV